jgi:hypothetical protein
MIALAFVLAVFPSSALACNTNVTAGVCIVGEAAAHVIANSSEACCAACAAQQQQQQQQQQQPACLAWQLSTDASVTHNCALKTTVVQFKPGNCTSGSTVAPAPPTPAPPAPPAPAPPTPAPPAPPAVAFDNMFHGGAVLQRGEHTPVWGTAAAGASVDVRRAGEPAVTAVANSSGIWLALLPPHPETYNVTLSASLAGGELVVSDAAAAAVVVSFGEVLLCVGQSNMGMQVGPSERGFDADNATAEAAAAGRFSGRIQLFASGGARTRHKAWYTVDPVEIRNYSAVCWLAGRDLFTSLGEAVPVGLILSAIGAHPIESWLGPAELASCGVAPGAPCEAQMPMSQIFYKAIVPLAPFKLGFMIFDQAEADVNCKSLAPDAAARIGSYACLQEQLVRSYRAMFNCSRLGFAAVQLPGYSPVQQQGIFEMRLQQDAGARSFDDDENQSVVVVPTYDLSCAENTTHGCPHGNVHNVHKQPVGARLAAQIMRMHLRRPGTVQGPRVARWSTAPAADAQGRRGFNVTVAFAGGSAPFVLRPTRNCTACCGDDAELGDVGDFDASSDGGVTWLDGTMPALVNGSAVRFFVNATADVQRVRYTANRVFPQCALHNQEGYPAFPFDEKRQ